MSQEPMPPLTFPPLSLHQIHGSSDCRARRLGLASKTSLVELGDNSLPESRYIELALNSFYCM